MPIYTDDPGQGINQPIGNAPSGLGESLLYRPMCDTFGTNSERFCLHREPVGD